MMIRQTAQHLAYLMDKITLSVVVVVAIVALVESHHCGGIMHNDASVCNHTCPVAGEAKACEKGICTCAKQPTHCRLRSDCDVADCDEDHNIVIIGHHIPMEAHCLDNICQCQRSHHIHIGPADVGNIFPGGNN